MAHEMNKAPLVFGRIICILTIVSLLSPGVLESHILYPNIIHIPHLVIAAWYLICGIISIVAGATGAKTLIVLPVIGALTALAGLTVSIIARIVTPTFISIELQCNSRDAFGMGIGMLAIYLLTFTLLIIIWCFSCSVSSASRSQTATAPVEVELVKPSNNIPMHSAK